jgi:hypothetical protein
VPCFGVWGPADQGEEGLGGGLDRGGWDAVSQVGQVGQVAAGFLDRASDGGLGDAHDRDEVAPLGVPAQGDRSREELIAGGEGPGAEVGVQVAPRCQGDRRVRGLVVGEGCQELVEGMAR